jgi:hypothetical protein
MLILNSLRYRPPTFWCSPGEVTPLLQQTGGKAMDEEVVARLVPLVYRELRRLANSCLRRPGETMQATDLVHEAYLKLVDQQQVSWQNRAGSGANSG